MLEMVGSLSILLLVFGLIASMGNVRAKGVVLNDNLFLLQNGVLPYENS